MTEACESNAKDLTIDDDDNYGFSRDWIKVPVNYSQMIKSKYAYYERKEPFSYQRLLWFNMNWDLKRVHLEVFKYLWFYFDQYHDDDFAQLSDEDAFARVFEGLTEENQDDHFGYGDIEGNAPYTLQVINPEKQSYYSPACKVCGEKKCKNCPIGFSGGSQFKDLVEAYFRYVPKKKKQSSNYPMTSIYPEFSSDEEDNDVPMNDDDLQKRMWNDNIYKEEMSYYSRTKMFNLEVYFKRSPEADLEKASRNIKHEKFDEFEEQSFEHKAEEANLYSCLDANQT